MTTSIQQEPAETPLQSTSPRYELAWQVGHIVSVASLPTSTPHAPHRLSRTPSPGRVNTLGTKMLVPRQNGVLVPLWHDQIGHLHLGEQPNFLVLVGKHRISF